MTRRLAGLERQFYQQNLVGSTNIVCVLVFDSPLDSSQIRKSLATLMHHYPVLAYALVADPYIRFLPQQLSTLPYSETQTDDWRAEMEQAFNRQYPETQIHLHHLQGQTSTFLIGLNHAIADGLSSLTLARDLVRLYNDETIEANPHGLGIENRLPTPFRGARGWWQALRFIGKLAKMGPALQIGSLKPTRHTESLGFSFTQTKELNAIARDRGSNFFALFSAVTLLALRDLYAPATSSTQISLNTPVSLRSAAAIPNEEIGVFIAGHLSLYTITKDTDVFTLARQCFTALKTGIAEGRPFHLLRLARGHPKPKPPKIPNKISSHRPTVSLSNLGRVEPFPKAGHAAITELHALSAQSMKDPFALILCSYQDRTFIDLQYSREKVGRDAAEQILAAVRQKMDHLSRQLT